MDTAAMGQAPTIGDIHTLPLAREVDTADIVLREAKSDILRRAREAAALRMRGNNGLARRIAKETSAAYRDLFSTDAPQPPDVTGMSPREIADLIDRKRPGT
jgi:hypothetical protein